MGEMTDSRALEVLAAMRKDGGTVAEADYTAAIDHAIARLREPAGVGGFTAADMMDARKEAREFAQQPAADLVEGLPFVGVVCPECNAEYVASARQPAAVDGACGDACAHIAIERDVLKANNERLAEALDAVVTFAVCYQLSEGDQCVVDARALLRPTAAPEADHA